MQEVGGSIPPSSTSKNKRLEARPAHRKIVPGTPKVGAIVRKQDAPGASRQMRALLDQSRLARSADNQSAAEDALRAAAQLASAFHQH